MSVARASRPPMLLVAAAALLAGGTLATSPAQAVTACMLNDIKALKVPDVTVTGASVNGAGACIVLGTVRTHGFGAPDGSAKIQVTLPAKWNQKFVQFGQGGFAGSLSASTNVGDQPAAAQAGYASAVTDTGHTGASATDARWALIAAHMPDQAKVTDYYFRAVHQVAEASKELVRSYYGSPLRRAYFDGCSNGGRQAFVEATRFPDDFDGIVAGAPFFDIRTILGGVKIQKVQLATAAAYIPAATLPLVDAAVYASCDKADGVPNDGLIQNPAKCSFDPNSLVPGILTHDQANTLKSYLTALRDDDGRLVYTGETISDLSSRANPTAPNGMDAWTTGFVPPFTVPGATPNEPWDADGFGVSPIAWQFVDHFIRYFVEQDPSFNMLDYDVSTSGQVGDAALKLFDKRSEAGDGDIPEKLLPFIARGKKLLIYHGLSDPALAATRTIKYYEDLAETAEMSFSHLQDHVRLFLVPACNIAHWDPGRTSSTRSRRSTSGLTMGSSLTLSSRRIS